MWNISANLKSILGVYVTSIHASSYKLVLFLQKKRDYDCAILIHSLVLVVILIKTTLVSLLAEAVQLTDVERCLHQRPGRYTTIREQQENVLSKTVSVEIIVT